MWCFWAAADLAVAAAAEAEEPAPAPEPEPEVEAADTCCCCCCLPSFAPASFSAVAMAGSTSVRKSPPLLPPPPPLLALRPPSAPCVSAAGLRPLALRGRQRPTPRTSSTRFSSSRTRSSSSLLRPHRNLPCGVMSVREEVLPSSPPR